MKLKTHALRWPSDLRIRSIQPSLFSATDERWWLNFFVLLGLFARFVRFALCFPLWDDESFLCVNFISRSYAALLQPLDYHQVAPILFLWIERTAVGLAGYSELALRSFPFACSIAGLLLFRRTAARLLSGPALVLAVAIFAVSYPAIRYSAEAKPYGSDLLISLLVLHLAVDWLQRRETRFLWMLCGLMPLALGVSYPAVFTAGGLSLVVLVRLYRQGGTTPEWRAWFSWNLCLAASFLFWFWLSASVQNGAEAEFMGNYWKSHFPPMREPWMLPYWLLRTHASDFLAYPVGGPNWASTMTLLLAVAGLYALWRSRRIELLAICVAPAGLHFVAAALQRYPYGGHVKFSQYIAPAICMVAALGLVQMLEWWASRGYSSRRALARNCLLLCAIGVGIVAHDVARPYKTLSDFRSRAFARSFWYGAQQTEEVVCLESDLGLDLVPDQHRNLSWEAQFLCNREVETHRYRLPAADWSRLSSQRPLRCVLYRESKFPLRQAELDRWLGDMQRDFELLDHKSVTLPRYAKDERTLLARELIDSYWFVPRNGSGPPQRPLQLTERPIIDAPSAARRN